MNQSAVWVFGLLLAMLFGGPVSGEKHLFILSGQSNMARMDPEVSFIPAVEEAFGADRVIVVKDAQGGQPIRRWYKGWVPQEADRDRRTGDLYDRLMEGVGDLIEGERIETVTVIWMQGENDARLEYGDLYAESLRGLFRQFERDLGREDLFFVIGRISDFDMVNRRFPHWTRIREVQVEVAESMERVVWVSTDDLNDGLDESGKMLRNDLHYSVEGYRILGERFAEAAIGLIRGR